MKIGYCLLLFLGVVFFPKMSGAQLLVEDSLTAAIFAETDPHQKIVLMGDLASEMKQTDSQKAIEVAFQALDLAETKSETDIAFASNLIGYCYLEAEQFDSAMKYLDMAYKVAEHNADTVYMAKSLNNIGIVYLSLGDYELGLEKMEQSGWLEFQSKYYQDASTSYNNIGALQLQLGQHKKARLSLMKALDIARDSGDKENQSNAYLNLGALEFKMGDSEAGKAWSFKAIEILEKTNDLNGVSMAYNNLAYDFRERGNYRVALMYDLKSLEYAEKINSADAYRSAYNGLARDYEYMSDYKNALLNFKLYMDWKDTLSDRENTRTLIEMKERFDTEQTRKENQLLIKENLIKELKNKDNESKLNQSKILISFSVVALLLLLAIAFVLFNRNRIKQKANAELSVAYQTIQRSNAELQLANDIIREKNEDITASIEYASKIQEALLPTKENEQLFRDSFFLLMPKDIVSGDFIWYSEMGDKVVFAAADCTGHGVPGAFMSMIGHSFLNQIVIERQVLQPSLILDALREKVIVALSQQRGEDARKDGMDIAICVLDRRTRKLEFAGANNPLYYVKEGEIIEVKGDKQPVGYMPERELPFTNHTVQLLEGDAMYIFSDGYADQFGGPKGKKFKYKQMRDLLHQNYDAEMSEQKQVLIRSFYEWKGDLEQIDDICIIGVRV